MPDRATILVRALCPIIALAFGACDSSKGGASPDAGQADAAGPNDSGAPAPYDCLAGIELDAGAALWPGYCRKDIDQGADGRVDDTWRLEYDDEDRPVLFAVGAPPTGSQKRWRYDANGNLLREEHDTGLDDSWEVSVERTYDAHGNLLTQATDEDGDDTPERSLSNTYECFAAADEKLPGACTTDIDLDADGIVELVQSRAYDAAGHLLSVTERHAEHPDLTTRVTTHAYDAHGDRIETAVDVGADGLIEEHTERAYDAEHHLLRVRVDHDADGTIELQHDYTFDAHRALVREEKQEDGEPVYRFDFERDDDGLVTLETETYFASPEDDRELRRYHDRAGNPMLEVLKRRTSSGPDACVSYGYACFD